MSLTSSDNHWMFISSNGALTAGREKAEQALFPYITDNLIHTSLNTTGPRTKINIYKNNEKVNVFFKKHEKLAHYAKNACDIEFNFPFGFKEVEGIHSRSDFDLSQHQKFSGKKIRRSI